MTEAIKPARSLADFLRVLTAPAIWFAHLVIVYGAEALICVGPAGSGGRAMLWIVGVATAAALMALAMSAALLTGGRFTFSRRSRRTGPQFLSAIAVTLTFLSGLAVIWSALPAAVLPACASAS